MTAPQPRSRQDLDQAELAAFARRVGDAAAEAVADFVSIIWKGSGRKDWEGPYDFFPGLSDIDIHIYRHGGVGDLWELRRYVHDRVGEAPLDTPLQLLVLDLDTLPKWWTLLPGTYDVLHGETPDIAVPPTDLLLERDHIGLAQARGDAERIAADVLGRPDNELWTYLRSVRFMFPPTLYRAVSVETGRPEEIWALNRTRLLATADEHPDLTTIKATAISYFEAGLAAGRNRGDGTAAQDALACGQRLLRSTAAWADTRPDSLVDRRAAPPHDRA